MRATKASVQKKSSLMHQKQQQQVLSTGGESLLLGGNGMSSKNSPTNVLQQAQRVVTPEGHRQVTHDSAQRKHSQKERRESSSVMRFWRDSVAINNLIQCGESPRDARAQQHESRQRNYLSDLSDILVVRGDSVSPFTFTDITNYSGAACTASQSNWLSQDKHQFSQSKSFYDSGNSKTRTGASLRSGKSTHLAVNKSCQRYADIPKTTENSNAKSLIHLHEQRSDERSVPQLEETDPEQKENLESQELAYSKNETKLNEPLYRLSSYEKFQLLENKLRDKRREQLLAHARRSPSEHIQNRSSTEHRINLRSVGGGGVNRLRQSKKDETIMKQISVECNANEERARLGSELCYFMSPKYLQEWKRSNALNCLRYARTPKMHTQAEPGGGREQQFLALNVKAAEDQNQAATTLYRQQNKKMFPIFNKNNRSVVLLNESQIVDVNQPKQRGEREFSKHSIFFLSDQRKQSRPISLQQNSSFNVTKTVLLSRTKMEVSTKTCTTFDQSLDQRSLTPTSVYTNNQSKALQKSPPRILEASKINLAVSQSPKAARTSPSNNQYLGQLQKVNNLKYFKRSATANRTRRKIYRLPEFRLN